MLEELQRRNIAPGAIRYYIRTVRDFAAYFHKPPDQLGVEELRQFQLHMTGGVQQKQDRSVANVGCGRYQLLDLLGAQHHRQLLRRPD